MLVQSRWRAWSPATTRQNNGNASPDVIATFFGTPITIDDAVYRSESETGFRNRAIAWMLKNFGIIDGDPMPMLENYFRQCSVSVTCRDLAFMAATLANGGVHPLTGKRAVPAEEVQTVLSIMATCGMYDYAGSWLYDVGLPAKSGVSGGVIAVLPGRFGIAIFSPRLDENGNSVRGIAVCRRSRTSSDCTYSAPRFHPRWCWAEASRRRTRPRAGFVPPRAAAQLRPLASRIKCLSLQGEVAFDGAEFVVRKIIEMAPDADSFILDMHRVSYMTDSAARLLHDLHQMLAYRTRRSSIRASGPGPVVEDALTRTLPDDQGFLTFEDNDLAVEWCEDRLLEGDHGTTGADRLAAGRFPLFAGMCEQTLALLQARMEPVEYPTGATIIAAGQEKDDRVFLIREGEVSVVLSLAHGAHQRIATLSSGMTFGEMVMLGQAARSARCAPIRCAVLDPARRRTRRLAVAHPEIKIAVLTNLSIDLAQKLRQANQLIGALAA